MKFTFIYTFFVLCFAANAQIEHTYVYRNPQDSSYNCYLKLVPTQSEIKGLIVRDFTSLPNTSKKSPYKLQDLALDHGYIVLYAVTSNHFPGLYYDYAPAMLLDEIIHEVMSDHQISSDQFIIGGMSASGTRAARYSQYCLEGKSKYGHIPKGLFLIDSPLDLERFYISSDKHGANFKAGMAEESKLMMRVFPEQFGTTPYENPEVYRNNSVFSHQQPDGGNSKYFEALPIIIFHEPDINWWIEERGCSYYDINSYDLAAFATTLRQLGNQNVELVSTTGKGFDRKGNRKPHSWSIVNEEYLIEWVEKVFNE